MSIDWADVPDIRELAARTQVAAKAHKCAQCGDTINPGEKYTVIVERDGDVFPARVFNYKMHLHGACPRWEAEVAEYDRWFADEEARMAEEARA